MIIVEPTPDLTPPPDPAEAPPNGLAGIWESHKYALIALGGLAVLAVVLSATARRRGVFPAGSAYVPGSLENEVQRSADWEASLRHFAAAVDMRMQGQQQQLDALHRQVGTEGPAVHPSQTVTPNGQAPNVTYESAVADQPENVPPGPAATSQP